MMWIENKHQCSQMVLTLEVLLAEVSREKYKRKQETVKMCLKKKKGSTQQRGKKKISQTDIFGWNKTLKTLEHKALRWNVEGRERERGKARCEEKGGGRKGFRWLSEDLKAPELSALFVKRWWDTAWAPSWEAARSQACDTVLFTAAVPFVLW